MASVTAFTPTNPQSENVLSRAAVQLRQFMCGLHGHDTLKHFEHGRISLLCTSCGYESPGWEVRATGVRREGAESSRVVSMPLVREHRAA
jgi:hypothetical protein